MQLNAHVIAYYSHWFFLAGTLGWYRAQWEAKEQLRRAVRFAQQH